MRGDVVIQGHSPVDTFFLQLIMSFSFSITHALTLEAAVAIAGNLPSG